MGDEELSEQFHDFLTYYAFLTLVLLMSSFWHIAFLIAMGFITSISILFKYTSLEAANQQNDISKGFILFFMGALYGAVDYLSAIALSYNKQTIMKMVSFTAKEFTKKNTVKTKYTDYEGVVSTETTITSYHDLFKNFLALDEILTIWPDLFWA